MASDSQTGKVLNEWFNKLQHRAGDRAQLRRCAKPQAVAFVPVYFEFLNDFNKAFKEDNQDYSPRLDRLQAVFGLLSHIKNITANKNSGELMSVKNGDNERVSKSRFQKILRIDNLDDLFTTLVRTIRLTDGEANIYDLSQLIYFWGDYSKRRLAYQYFGHQDKL
ncbi:MAG: type I-E CRISPR-associated protein Cse2/CasB [Leptospiraceae bacterium]|nr:type I-E CRISPR-associated protein Cse2/CasB [Leptospiraceae bacterium]